MDLGRVVRASNDVAATSSKRAKVGLLADLLGEAPPEEIEAIIGFLLAAPRQQRLGVGWAQLAGAGVRSSSTDRPEVESSPITVVELDAVLDRLTSIGGAGSQLRRRGELDALFSRADEAEARFLRGLLLGEIRQGALAGVLADAVAAASGVVAADVRRAAMLSGSLAAAARAALTGGTETVRAIGLVPCHPVQPMLAASAPSIAAAFEDVGTASVEWKLDGARVQVHRQGDEVRIFTRNLNDITGRLPQVADIVRSLEATSFVLDGEVLGLDADGRPGIFQETMSRFGSDEVGAAVGLRPYFFDVLHLDGVDLLDEPLSARQEVLERLCPAWRLPTLVTADVAAAERFGADALAAGHEGVMVKGIDSAYEAGRRGSRWIKVKPVRTLDLVVLAAEWGHGRRAGWLSNLHLGARHPDGGFVMVGKTFKGMTDALLRWQTDALQKIRTNEESADSWVVEVRPELVVEIAVDGVQRSSRYPGGVALRFARVRAYRPDRSAADANSIDDVRALLHTTPA